MSEKQTFGNLYDLPSRGGWCVDLGGPARREVVLVSSLVGKTVNIGDKDGGVYDSVTLESFDERHGILVLTGGRQGSAYRDGSRPVDRPVHLWAHDVARGYVHADEEAPAAG